MSKRSRGPARSSHRRPGSRPPSPRSARSAPREPSEASELEPTTALVADRVVDDDPVLATADPERTARAAGPRHRPKPGSVLAAKAATEYVYVAQDLRRILVVSAVLFVVLAVLWLVFVVLRFVPLDFY